MTGDKRKRRKDEAGTNEESSAHEEDKPNEIVLEDNVVHKKKIKKNIESRDACTQTDRSDLMHIKHRQRRKELA